MGWLSNYCGVDILSSSKGLLTQHEVDQECKLHDEAYDDMLRKGINPYWRWNEADELFKSRIEGMLRRGGMNRKEQILANIATKVFNFKEYVNSYIGLDTIHLNEDPTWIQGYHQFIEENPTITGDYYNEHDAWENDWADNPGVEEYKEGDQPIMREDVYTDHELSFQDSPSEEEDESMGLGKEVSRIPPIKATRKQTKPFLTPPSETTMIQRHSQSQPGQPGNSQAIDEEQISPIKDVWTRFPNTQNCKLKYVLTRYLGTSAAPATRIPWDNQEQQVATDLNTTGGGAWSAATNRTILSSTLGVDLYTPELIQARMTSPYNIMKQINGTGWTGQPSWLRLFDSKYRYYHVPECDWKMNFHFGPINNGSATEAKAQHMVYHIFWRYTAQDDPPIQYTVSGNSIAHTTETNVELDVATKLTGTPAGNTLPLSQDDYLRMGGWHHEMVTTNSTHPTMKTISGKYKFGQCKMNIKTILPSDADGADTTAEGWTETGSTPVFPEILSVIIVQDTGILPISGFKTPLSIQYSADYLIQFKDLDRKSVV